jgi:hypothetical protein
MRAVPLATLKTGITRLRDKGGAQSTSLYDLVNGFVDDSGSPTIRPGTRQYHRITTSNTKGCATFNNKIVVFSHQVVDPGHDDFICMVLRHPTDPNALIEKIHYAKPFKGEMYVVAEFDDETTWHYSVKEPEAWQANHVYMEGGVVQPTVPNGYTYMATRLGPPNPLWAPNVERAVGDRVEPTEANGYYYEVTDTQGDNPKSGATEPTWIAAEGAIVYEDASGSTVTPPTYPGDGGPIYDNEDRYDNPGGSRPGSGTIDERSEQ